MLAESLSKSEFFNPQPEPPFRYEATYGPHTFPKLWIEGASTLFQSWTSTWMGQQIRAVKMADIERVMEDRLELDRKLDSLMVVCASIAQYAWFLFFDNEAAG